MDRLAVQYLEGGPDLARIEPGDAQARLRAAFDRLPISDVLLGWNLPEVLICACADQAGHANARLYRWHPLLTGDGTFVPRLEWQSIGLGGDPVPGFQGMPEFTFVCPNRPEVHAAVLDHLREVCTSGFYHGIFLDRIRCPSPARNPAAYLACFCDDCRRVAEGEGLDLDVTRQYIGDLFSNPERARSAVQVLLGPVAADVTGTDLGLAALYAFLAFRARTVTRFACEVARVIRESGLEIGLDCFSPALACMVGQDLGALDSCCDWIKIMSYGHALGPAGLPFETLALVNWLMDSCAVGEFDALVCVGRASRSALPTTRHALRKQGLSSAALAAEVHRARNLGVSQLLAGIELVELEGVSCLDSTQIAADLRAIRSANPDGLALSWDLLRIPLERLDLVRKAWDLG